MYQPSIGTGNPNKGKIPIGLQGKKKSKAKIQGIPKPSPTHNGGKFAGVRNSWQKLKTARKSAKSTEKDSVNFVNEAANETDLQLETLDADEKSEKATIPTSENDGVKEGNATTKIGENGMEKPKTANGKATVEFKKEKSTLLIPRAPSSKKERSGVGGETDGQNGLLPRRDSTKLSLDAASRVSVDAAVQNTTAVVYPPEEKQKSVFSNNDSWIRSAIPCLPLCLSVICLIMNILIPGSGTILSGLSILCCGQTRIATKDDQVMVTLCTNVWVGFAQLFTVSFLFVGWFWSLAWGLKMVSLAVEHRQQKKQERERQLQSLALRAFGSPLNVRPFTRNVH